MKITALVTLSPWAGWSSAAVEPFVLVYDLFKPEGAVDAVRRHVADRARLSGYNPQWVATREGRNARILLTGRSIVGDAVDEQDLVANVTVLSRFTQSVSCPSCDATWVWSALKPADRGEPVSVREAEAVGCDECGWIVSDHPVAGRPSVQPLDDQVEISGAQS